MNRRYEKIGWIGGWLGGFLWLALLSGVWIVQNRTSHGAVGILLFTLALVLILAFAPWKYPETKYWKLMLPISALFFISIGWCIYLYGGLRGMGLSPMSLFWVVLWLVPFVTNGHRRWNGHF